MVNWAKRSYTVTPACTAPFGATTPIVVVSPVLAAAAVKKAAKKAAKKADTQKG